MQHYLCTCKPGGIRKRRRKACIEEAVGSWQEEWDNTTNARWTRRLIPPLLYRTTTTRNVICKFLICFWQMQKINLRIHSLCRMLYYFFCPCPQLLSIVSAVIMILSLQLTLNTFATTRLIYEPQLFFWQADSFLRRFYNFSLFYNLFSR